LGSAAEAACKKAAFRSSLFALEIGWSESRLIAECRVPPLKGLGQNSNANPALRLGLRAGLFLCRAYGARLSGSKLHCQKESHGHRLWKSGRARLVFRHDQGRALVQGSDKPRGSGGGGDICFSRGCKPAVSQRSQGEFQKDGTAFLGTVPEGAVPKGTREFLRYADRGPTPTTETNAAALRAGSLVGLKASSGQPNKGNCNGAAEAAPLQNLSTHRFSTGCLAQVISESRAAQRRSCPVTKQGQAAEFHSDERRMGNEKRGTRGESEMRRAKVEEREVNSE
jgi:hypothetical protein